ncbi:hypothetical protein LO772_03075 [Yinghuangia sp. ASG 101]|uniref:hypothetical protein n=1 Tax=Yinghuangia sp. ASG 101 TaxID=2896848 RepID=UPI001E2FF821|nr:hypothetical protein [Yinghuangia sp. ASG 101]UGQ12615.1 hypothetical protein LO772_03075 [Yinghuangia sp. ASG 101]
MAVTLALGAAGSLVACGGGSKKADWAEICVRSSDQTRVLDAECLVTSTPTATTSTPRPNAAIWYYIPRKSGGKSNFVPSVGAPITTVTGGTFSRPGKGKIVRGGFGGSGKSSGTTGSSRSSSSGGFSDGASSSGGFSGGTSSSGGFSGGTSSSGGKGGGIGSTGGKTGGGSSIGGSSGIGGSGSSSIGGSSSSSGGKSGGSSSGGGRR